jgi:hypothetical protein
VSRHARLEILNGWYRVINCGHQRKAIFRDRRCFRDDTKRSCYDIHLNPVWVGILKGVEAEEGALDKTLLRKRRERLRDPQLRKRLSAVARHLNVQC